MCAEPGALSVPCLSARRPPCSPEAEGSSLSPAAPPLPSLESYDEVVLLEGGEICGRGPHWELLEERGC